MVIGGGLMAQAFQRYKNIDGVLIFASGVSSSKICSVSDRAREEDLLRKTLDGYDNKILFVYFSSCSIASSNLTNDTYHTHKKKMEGIIQTNAKRYTIFRLPNVVGGAVNPDTLFYYLVNKVRLHKEFDLWSGVKRNIIDIDDVVNIVSNIIHNVFFVNEIIREKILLNYKKEIPYSVEVITESFDEEPHIIKIRSIIMVERTSQKGIIIGHKGGAIKIVGTQARIDMEVFFDKKIFLDLQVKVNKNWRSSEKQLKRFGYNQK